jgi:hypothetical protein
MLNQLAGVEIAYDPNTNITGNMWVDTTSHEDAASYLLRGRIPPNLLEVSKASNNFRDAVLNLVVSAEDTTGALEVLVKAIRATPDNSPELVQYSEYAAAIAYARSEPVLAARIIMRNEFANSSTLLKTFAMTLSKSVEGSAFKKLLIDGSQMAVNTWTTLERPTLYPND